MNLDTQVHLHVVPRYASPRRWWHDRTFTDEHQGAAFGDEQRALPASEFQVLACEIRARLTVGLTVPARRLGGTPMRRSGRPSP
jgi:diadenosine tetraphosphate (Ap4A) HIT family hydrolase